MNDREYVFLLMRLEEYSDEQLQQAAEFYLRSPDGQYDRIAEDCIRMTLELRTRVR